MEPPWACFNQPVSFYFGMVRDADDTRRRLLEAATAEFAAYGIAGARVDRIAAAAQANKALIYSYFGSKEQLFAAAFNAGVVATMADVPFDVDDLPGYAARLFDYQAAHPETYRLAVWARLEWGDTGPQIEAANAANARKIEQVAAAQAAGRLSARFAPDQLLGLILAIASSNSASPERTGLSDSAGRRAAIVTAVKLLIEQPA